MTPLQRTILFGTPALDLRTVPNLAAWYDLSDPLSYILGTGVKLLGDKSGNSAVNGLVLNGVSGNYASTPDSVALSVTGDLDIRAQVAMDTWTPAAETTVIGKWNTGQLSYLFRIRTAGQIILYTSPDGSALSSGFSSVATGFSAFSSNWIRATRVAASGVLTFYTSADGVTWNQLGTPSSNTSGNIFDSTAAVEVGSNNGGTLSLLSGRVFRAQIYNGIAGTLVFDADFSKAAKLAATFTESSANAATVTINTSGDFGARISGARDLVQLTGAKQPTLSGGGMRFTAAGSQYMASAPFALAQSWCDYPVLQQVAWSSGKYLLDGLTQNTGGLVMTTSTPQLDLNAGSAVAANTGLAVGVKGLVRRLFNGASSSLGVNRNAVTTGNAGAGVPNGLIAGACGATIGSYSDTILYEWPVFASALPPQDALIVSQLIRKWKIKA